MTFARACAAADVVMNRPRAATVGGVPVVVVSTDEGWFCIHDECSHAEVPLSDGDVEDCHIECYMHGSRFNLRTGEVLNPPAVKPVATYPTRVVEGQVQVDVAD